MLEATGICDSYGGKAVLKHVDVAVAPGQVLVIVGPNGSGKSTLLSVLSGSRKPAGGAVHLQGASIRGMSPQDLARQRAVLEQTPARDVPYTVGALASLGIPREVPPAVADRIVCESLAQTGTAAFRNTRLDRLSGGEAHRSHLARALSQLNACKTLGGGKHLLLDEPTASLDLQHQVAVLDVVSQAASDGVGVVIVLHDLSLAAAVADTVLLLCAGEVAAVGKPRDVLTPSTLQPVYGLPLTVGNLNGQPIVVPDLGRLNTFH